MSGEGSGAAQTRRSWLVGAGLMAGGLSAGATACAEETPVSIKPTGAPIPMAVLVDKGATLIDFAGPWEIFSSAVSQCPGFQVYSIAPTREPIRCDNGRGFSPNVFRLTQSGLAIVPDYTFEDAPQPKILVVGAQSGSNDPKKMAWIKSIYPKLDLAMSVCVGAYVLGFAGLLDGLSATTNAHAYDDFQKTFPKVNVVRGVRFVEAGKVATATGLTAGIDLAMRVVERTYGQSAASRLARYEEWKSTEWQV
jgi:transcriptional regulator GlxA family with amidase domain